MNKIELPLISNVRKNHALEHASINILSKKFPSVRIFGHSDHAGFWLHTDLRTEDITDAVTEAIERLRAGETGLAYHPYCGTNLAVSGIAAGLGAFIGMWGVGKNTRDRFQRLPLVTLLSTIALILSQPLGKQVQKKVTTDTELEDLKIIQITRNVLGGKTAHRIETKG